jgi:hypothetical protein
MNYGQITEIAFHVKNPSKAATVRLPTAEEWFDRMRHRKSIRRNLGRRKSTTKMLEDRAADLALFNRIKIAGDDFDEFEAQHFIGLLSNTDVVDSKREDGGYRVELEWNYGAGLEGKTIHHLRMPTLREVSEYRRGVVTIVDLPHNQEELNFNLQAACDLYDKLVQKSEGYAESIPVPPIHKGPVVTEILQLSDETNEEPLPADDEDFTTGSGKSPAPQPSAS